MEKIKHIDCKIERYVVSGQNNRSSRFYIFWGGKKLISLGLIQINVILSYFLLFTKIMQLDRVNTMRKIGLKQMLAVKIHTVKNYTWNCLLGTFMQN